MATTPMDRELTRLLTEGQAAAKRGDKAMARALLTQLVEKEPRHEDAWMWLSGVVADPFEQQICLENALVINPGNAQARKGLEYIAARNGSPARVPEAAGDTAGNGSAPEQPVPNADVFAEAANLAPAPQSPFGGDAAPFGQPGLPADGLPPWAIGDPEFAADKGQPQAFEAAQAAPSEVAQMPAPENGFAASAAAHDFNIMDAQDMGLPAGTQPFVPPGADDGAHHADDGIPDWLGNLTPSVGITEEPHYQQSYGNFDHSEFAVGPPTSAPPTTMVGDLSDMMMEHGSQAFNLADEGQTPGDLSGTAQPALHGAFSDPGATDLGPMGPYTELQMPAPNELPGGAQGFADAAEHQSHDGPAGSGQPWYLQSNTGTMAPMPDPDGMPSARGPQGMLDDNSGKRAVAMVDCPNCRERVPDTSLACPSCRYSFFVNCPFCHELVDTSDARPDVTEPCPYCQNTISKMEMGLGTINDQASQKIPGSRPGMAHADPKHAFPSMQQQIVEGHVVERRPAIAWVVDFMWLVAIIVMVWALTQLPTWLNLSGQY